MAKVFDLDTDEVRRESRRAVSALGGELCDWLPWLGRSAPRERASVVRRVLVMHAMLQIYFGAPCDVIGSWLERHSLLGDLSRREKQILAAGDDELTEKDETDLYWYIEALWAFAWVGSLIEDIPIEQPVGDELAAYLPSLQNDEGPNVLDHRFVLREPGEVYRKLDLYYLAHWYARDGALRGRDTAPFSMDIIMERRKALEWVLDAGIQDWDDTTDGT